MPLGPAGHREPVRLRGTVREYGEWHRSGRRGLGHEAGAPSKLGQFVRDGLRAAEPEVQERPDQ